jgi:hypothetical protein
VGLNEIRTDESCAVLALEEERDRLDREQVGTG